MIQRPYNHAALERYREPLNHYIIYARTPSGISHTETLQARTHHAAVQAFYALHPTYTNAHAIQL